MTAATLTHLPVAAGGAVLASAGRTALWALSLYMRAPLTNTAVAALVGFSLMAGSNALYLQQQEHPAPLFAPTSPKAAPVTQLVQPVVPASRTTVPVLKPVVPDLETTGSLQREADAVIGNADVAELQSKLQQLKLFDGTVDGWYGPQTAGAIRRFEEKNGLKPTGELTREIMEAVLAAPIAAAPTLQPLAAPLSKTAEPAPQSAAEPQREVAPVVERALGVQPTGESAALEPLPAPAPLALEAPAGQKKPVLHRELPETPQEAMNIAVETAGDAIDTIIAGVQTVVMTPPKRRVPQAIAQEYVPEPAQAPVAEAPAADPVAQIVAAEAPPPPAAVLQANAAPASQPVAPAAQKVALASVASDADDTDAAMPPFSVTDPVMVARVQRGLASLGFLHGPADGVAGEATAKAIRNFEVYFNYKVTGRITPELADLLVANGASL